jgi:dimethylamine monooxygenase subunit A
MRYLPFLSGIYTTAPGLVSTTRSEGYDALIFQIDDLYPLYIANKKDCRQENIYKYYCEEKLLPETMRSVNQYLVKQLVQEHPQQFKVNYGDRQFTNTTTHEEFSWQEDWLSIDGDSYKSLFDALCSQVQEDIAVVQLSGDDDWLAAIHLCSPNHWSPGDKIGRPFSATHAPVPGMEKTLQHYRKMLESIVHASTPFTRFAWGIATDTRLNHHPIAPPDRSLGNWQGRDHQKNNGWFIRTERQNLVGLADVNAFLFTIRTYFYRIDELSAQEKSLLLKALQSMSPEALEYKGLTGSIHLLEEYLKV